MLALVSAFIFLFIFALKAEASNFYFPKITNRNSDYFQKQLDRLCSLRIKIHDRFPRFPVPRMCKTKNIKPPTLEFYAEPTSVVEGGSAKLSWASDNTISCEASGGWLGEKTLSGEEMVSPSTDTTYTLSCDGVEDGIEKSVLVEVVPLPPPPPVPTLDHIIISEVYYDVASDKGDSSKNEWIEIYNGTGSSVDISNWVIADVSAEFDLIPPGTVIPNLGFVVLTASSTTSDFWGVPVISLNTARLGNNLGNDGDTVYLKNSASTTVDSMSYGIVALEVFTPTAPDVAKGHSLRKIATTTDNGATYWEDLPTPTPGSF
ncbi:MAG: lamin tail domain-containing protein [Candidatus Zambryskibacteria bacterium]